MYSAFEICLQIPCDSIDRQCDHTVALLGRHKPEIRNDIQHSYMKCVLGDFHKLFSFSLIQHKPISTTQNSSLFCPSMSVLVRLFSLLMRPQLSLWPIYLRSFRLNTTSSYNAMVLSNSQSILYGVVAAFVIVAAHQQYFLSHPFLRRSIFKLESKYSINVLSHFTISFST